MRARFSVVVLFLALSGFLAQELDVYRFSRFLEKNNRERMETAHGPRRPSCRDTGNSPDLTFLLRERSRPQDGGGDA